MGFRFFTFPHTCFKSKRRGGNWSGWLPVECRQTTAANVGDVLVLWVGREEQISGGDGVAGEAFQREE